LATIQTALGWMEENDPALLAQIVQGQATTADPASLGVVLARYSPEEVLNVMVANNPDLKLAQIQAMDPRELTKAVMRALTL
jgi:hypothetical protein